MATHAPEKPADEAPPRRIRPNQIVIGIGVAVGLFSAVSGVVPLITEWHDDSPVQREVFGNIPSALKLAFYTVVPMLIVYGAVLFSQLSLIHI